MKTLITEASALIFATVLALPVSAASGSSAIQALLQEYRNSGAGPFNAEAGRRLWTQEFDGRRCSSCHSDTARAGGKHHRTGKVIKAMAPSVNAQSLSERNRIEKWFLRNCKWTFKRECTPQEKGDVLVWLNQQ